MPLSAPLDHKHDGRTPGTVLVNGADYSVIVGAPVYYEYQPGNIGVRHQIASGSTGAKAVQDSFAAFADTRYSQLTFDLYFDAAPSAANLLCQLGANVNPFGGSTGGAVGNLLAQGSGGVPQFRARANGDVALVNTSFANLAFFTVYTVYVRIDTGTTTSNGRMHARLVRLSDGVVMYDQEIVNYNGSSRYPSYTTVGKNSSAGSADQTIDNVRISNQAYEFLPRFVEAADQSTSVTGLATPIGFGSPSPDTFDQRAVTPLVAAASFGTPSIEATDSRTTVATSAPAAFGTPVVTASASRSASGLGVPVGFGVPVQTASGERSLAALAVPAAFGTPSISTTASRSVTGFANTPITFGIPGVTVSDSRSPSGLAVPNDFGVPQVTVSDDRTPTPLLVPVTWGAVTTLLTASRSTSGVRNVITYGTPTVTKSLARDVEPFGNEVAFGTPVLAIDYDHLPLIDVWLDGEWVQAYIMGVTDNSQILEVDLV